MRGVPAAWSGRLRELWGRYKYALMVAAAGAALLLLPGGGEGEEGLDAPDQTSSSFSVEEMEEKLERSLSQIRGAGEVTVVLTVREGERQVVAQDVERRESEERRETVILSGGSGGDGALTLQHLPPLYQGALVVCDGGDDPAVELEITGAVRALTGLSSDRISVCKRG